MKCWVIVRAMTVAAGFFGLTATNALAGIPIPCTGDKIVKVAELPSDLAKDGQHFDIGYMFSWCMTGEFVGYLGDGRRYFKFNQEMQEKLRGSIPVPGFWSTAWANKGQFWVEWLWIVLTVLAAVALIKNKIVHGTFAHPSTIAKREAEAATKAAPETGAASSTHRIARTITPAATSAAAFGRR